MSARDFRGAIRKGLAVFLAALFVLPPGILEASSTRLGHDRTLTATAFEPYHSPRAESLAEAVERLLGKDFGEDGEDADDERPEPPRFHLDPLAFSNEARRFDPGIATGTFFEGRVGKDENGRPFLKWARPLTKLRGLEPLRRESSLERLRRNATHIEPLDEPGPCGNRVYLDGEISSPKKRLVLLLLTANRLLLIEIGLERGRVKYVEIQAYLDEKLILSSGETLFEAPFSIDLVLYHPPLTPQEQSPNTAGSVGAMSFRVSPSPKAAQVLLDSGYDNIRLFPFPDQIERGTVLGPAGGTITNDDGVELTLPEGALTSKTVVSARLLTSAELASYPIPQGYDRLAAVRVDLSGFTLNRPATVRLNTPNGTTPDPDPRVILSSFVDQPVDGRGSFFRLVARASRSGSQEKITAAPEPAASGLPLEGLVKEGVYFVLRAQQSIGYATGFVKAANGFGYTGARVTATSLGTADITIPGGRYSLPVTAGAARAVEARHPDRDERGTATIATLATNQVVQQDITITPAPPQITGLQPANGATNQPIGSVLRVQFDKPLDPASVGQSAIKAEIANPDGTASGVYALGNATLSADHTSIVFTPARPLPPGRTILAAFTGGVRDINGTLYSGAVPATWSFTTSTQVVYGGQVNPAKIRIFLPVSGEAQIIGEPGALPISPGVPWAVRPDVDGPLVCPQNTVPANAQGGFSVRVGCPAQPVTLDTKVFLTVLDPAGGIAEVFRLTPFTTADGKGFVAPAGEETTFTTAEGVVVNVPATAFDRATLVTVTKLDLASLGVPVPSSMEVGAYLKVDFEGTAKDTLRVRLPVTTTAAVGTPVFIGTPYQAPWGARLQITDLGRIIDGGGGAKVLSNYRQDQPQDPPGARPRAPLTVGVCPDPSNPCCPAACAPGTPSCGICPDPSNPSCPTCATLKAQGCRLRVCQSLVESALVEMTTRGTNAFVYSKTNGLAAVTGFVDPSAVSGSFALYDKQADLFLFLPPPYSWGGEYILPGSTTTPFTIVRRDTATGWVLGQHDYSAVTPGPQLVDLQTFDPPATRTPILLDASPFSVTRFRSPGTEGTCAFVRLELDACVTTAGVVEIRPTTTALAPESRVTLYNITPSLVQIPPVRGPSYGCRVNSSGVLVDVLNRLCSPSVQATPSDELLLVVTPGDLDPDDIDALKLRFDRAVDKNTASVRLTDCGPTDGLGLLSACTEIPVDPQTTDGDKLLELRSNALLPRGHLYQLEIVQLLSKGTGPNRDYKGPDTFVFATRRASSLPVGTTNPLSLGDTDDARDLLKFGNLLVVASTSGNIVALDLTTPAVATVPAGRSLKPSLFAVMSEGGAQARSMATDGHDRLYFATTIDGGSWTIHNIKVEDILRSKAPAAGGSAPCTLPPAFASVSPAPNCFHWALGAARVSTAVGSTTGLTAGEYLSFAGSVPTGIPSKLEVVVSDHTDAKLELGKFYARYKSGGSSSAPPELPPGAADDRGFYTFGLSLSVTTDFPTPYGPVCGGQDTYRFQRATVDNLTTGQSWSFDIPVAGFPGNPGGNTLATPSVVRARAGDQLRVRFNLRALGYVAIVGGGITVLDLNRLYDTPSTDSTGTQFNKSQCGKRLSTYEGTDLALGACGGRSNFDGLRLTPAVAAVGLTGSASCSGTRGGGASGADPNVSVYSPLTHFGAIHSETFKKTSLFSSDFGMSFSVSEKVCLTDQLYSGYRASLRDVAIATDLHWDSLKSCPSSNPTDPNEPPIGKEGDLAFFSLGFGGVEIYDISARNLKPIGRFLVPKDAAVYRLQVDRASRRLYGGGFQTVNGVMEPRIFAWDISRPDLVPATAADPRLVLTLNAPWDTNHIAIDETGDGLLYTWGQGGGKILPISDPTFLFVGRTRDPNAPATGPPGSVYKPASRFVPLGIPTRALITEEVDPTNRKYDDENLASGFKVRVSLPAGMGDVLSAKVQTLTALPSDKDLADDTVGSFTAVPGGPGWPERDVYVTLKRVAYDGGTTNPDANDRSGKRTGAGSLYESLETVLLVADPRAKTGYQRQQITAPATELADEESQCRRCERPAHFPAPPQSGPDLLVKELLAGGPYVRVLLSRDPNAPANDPVQAATTEAVAFFQANKEGYRPPAGVASLTGWADEVPSPTQLILAEPAQNGATWNGEIGASISLVTGEATLQATDHSVPARGVGFAFSRTYRSSFLGYGPLGAAGWNAGLFAHLREVVLEGGASKQKPSYVDYHDGAGHVFRFVTPVDGACPGAIFPPPRGYWEPDPSGPAGFGGGSYCVPYGLPLTLQKLREGGFRLTSRTYETALFDPKGRLIEIADRHRRGSKDPLEQGSTLRLFYDAGSRLQRVEDEFERSYSFNYDGVPGSPLFGTLSTITDFSGRFVAYGYDSTTRLLTSVKLPEVDFKVPQSSGTALTQGHAQPTIAYAYDPPLGVLPNAPQAPLRGVFAPKRLWSVKLPAFLPGGVNPDRLRFEYEPATGRVAAVTVPNTLNLNEAASSLRTTFTPTLNPAREAVAQAVRVTPPWNHSADYAIGVAGQTDSIEAGQPVEVFTAPLGDGPIGAPSITPSLGSEKPKTLFEYKLDGRLAKVIGPDGGQVVYNYLPACDFVGVCPILAKGNAASVVRSFGAGQRGTATYADTATEITDRADNLPKSVKVDVGTDSSPVQKTVELGTVGSSNASGTAPTLPIVTGYTDDKVVSMHTDVDSFGQVGKTEVDAAGDGTGAGTHPPPTTVQAIESTVYGAYPRAKDGQGLLSVKQVGDPAQGGTKKIYELYEYDDGQKTLRGNLTRKSTSYGVQDTFKYDAWDRVISGVVGKADGRGSVPLQSVDAVFEKDYDQAGHLLRERRKQSGIAGFVETVYVYNAHEDVVEVRTTGASANQLLSPTTRTVSVTRDFDGVTGLLKFETRDRDDSSNEPGIKTEYLYDNAGRVKSFRDLPQGGEPSGFRKVAYDIASRPVFTTDGDLGASYSKVDALGRTYFEALPTGARVERTFDKQDRAVKEIVFGTSVDPQDPAKTVRNALSEKSTTYNSHGLLATEERIFAGTGSGSRRTTSLAYDRAGRVVEVWLEDPDNLVVARKLVERNYEPLTGKLVLEIDAYGNTVGPIYPDDSPWPKEIKRSEQPPIGGAGTIVTSELPEYDALGRVRRTTMADGTVVDRTLDEAGNVLRLTTGSENPFESLYDGRGLLLATERKGVPGSAVNYAYDAGGRLTTKRVARSVLAPDDTSYVYDTLGRLKGRTRPSSRAELFTHNPDGTVATWSTRLTNPSNQPLVLTYGYDAANRLVSRVPNASAFQGALPAGLAPMDLGDANSYDSLSRLTSASITLPGPITEAASQVTYGGYDMRSLPASETVGFWASTMLRKYDLFGNATSVALPTNLGVGTSYAGYARQFNQVDNLKRIQPTDGAGNLITSLNLGVEYDFGGMGRLHAFRTISPQTITETQSYNGAGARLSALTLSSQTGALGRFAFDWRTAQDVKQGKTATPAPTAFDLTQSAGFGFGHDTGHRLNKATSPQGTWSFGYGRADELETVTEPTGVRTGASGAEGRLTSLGSITFAYDAEGRRTSDDKNDYTWDWRGRLLTVDVKPTAPAHANSQIVYTYDALGRLLTRLLRGPRPPGSADDDARTKLDRRVFVWDGASLVTETGLNLTDPPVPVWRRQNVPGPMGMDDAFQVRLETNLQATPQARTFGFIKDELGTTLGVLEDKAGQPSLLARYLPSPYGEIHLESGPELLKAEYDPALTHVGTTTQTTTTTPPNETLPGALKATTTLPIDTATHAAGIVVERFDGTSSTWLLVATAEYVVGRDDQDANTLVVMRRNGWAKATKYRVRLKQDLKDGYARAFVPPQAGATEYDAILDVPSSGNQPPVYSQQYPLTYDSAKAASDTLTGAFPGGQTALYTGVWTDPITGLGYHRDRWYDPHNGVWLKQDSAGPVDSQNPYAYVGQRPNEYTDPTGEIAETVWDFASFGLGVWSFSQNAKEGNWGAAGLDAFGIGLDAVATAVPFLPGGVGVAIKASRAFRAARVVDQTSNVGQGLVQGGKALGEENYLGAALNYGMAVLGVHVASEKARELAHGFGYRMQVDSGVMGVGGGGFRMVGKPLDDAGGWATPLNPKAYSVLYETEIPESILKIRDRGLHNQAANKNLLADLNLDKSFEAIMEGLVPGLRRIEGSAGIRKISPGTDVTWHHFPKSNRMQLVWRYQHEQKKGPRWNALWQRLFHPEGRGGFADGTK